MMGCHRIDISYIDTFTLHGECHCKGKYSKAENRRQVERRKCPSSRHTNRRRSRYWTKCRRWTETVGEEGDGLVDRSGGEMEGSSGSRGSMGTGGQPLNAQEVEAQLETQEQESAA